MKTNDKVINKNNYNKTKKGKKERLDNHRKNNVILDNVNKRRVAYQNGTSVFNPDCNESMKIATVKTKRVVPTYRQSQLSNKKLNELRLILVVDRIRDNILYLNITSPKSNNTNSRKYLVIDNLLDKSNRHNKSVIDLYMDNLDYSLNTISKLNFDKIRINNSIKLSSKTMQKIYRATNSFIKNLRLSHNSK